MKETRYYKLLDEQSSYALLTTNAIFDHMAKWCDGDSLTKLEATELPLKTSHPVDPHRQCGCLHQPDAKLTKPTKLAGVPIDGTLLAATADKVMLKANIFLHKVDNWTSLPQVIKHGENGKTFSIQPTTNKKTILNLPA